MSESFHAYTRKEIISWVQKKQTKYKYEELKNGVFFCKMLISKFPQQAPTLKYNPNPISQYDCINNISLVKKTLNKHGLQLNMNIQAVVGSKNNFEIAKWFKNNIQTAQNNLIRNYSSVPIPRQSITSFRQNQSKKNLEETPKKVYFQKQVKKKMQSAQKQPKNSLSKVKRLSMAKSQAAFFKEKKYMMKTDLKIPVSKNDKKLEQLKQNRMYETTQKIQRSEQFSDGDDINEILYQRALEQSIESLMRIISKIKETASNCQIKDYNEYKKAIKLSIYSR